MRSFLFRSSSLCIAMIALLSGCATSKPSVYQHEEFSTTGTFSRNFPVPPASACEAARRALLSQGYIISKQQAELVEGNKHFQPTSDVHVVIEFHIVCAPDGENGHISVAFVNALQDKYIVKKSANSASVGVSALGSVSLPFGSTEESLTKVASETIQSEKFYVRFFGMVEHYLAEASEYEQPDAAPSSETAGHTTGNTAGTTADDTAVDADTASAPDQ